MTYARLFSLSACAALFACTEPEPGASGADEPAAATPTEEAASTAGPVHDDATEADHGDEPLERPEDEEDGDEAELPGEAEGELDDPSEEDATEQGGFDEGWDPPGDGGDEGADGGTDEEPEAEVAACDANRVQFQDAETGTPHGTLTSFVFHDDGETLWVMGFEAGAGADACAWAEDPTAAGGYQLLVEVSGSREAGATKTWMDDDADDAAELRLEDNGSGSLAESENDSGTLTISAYTAGDSLEVADVSGTLDDGSTIEAGTFTACYCGAMALE